MTNYFAPAFQVQVNGSHLQADISMNIETISVTTMPDSLDTFTFTITNAMPQMRWTHTSDADLFREGNSVSIAMGYVDDLQNMIEGEITSISPTFPADGTPTVTINGNTRLHRLRGSHRSSNRILPITPPPRCSKTATLSSTCAPPTTLLASRTGAACWNYGARSATWCAQSWMRRSARNACAW